MLLAAAMLAALVGGLAALAWVQGPAEAAFPGADGRIAFVGYDSEKRADDIYSMRPDGTGLRNLTDDATDDAQPAWSPDGRLIAFAKGERCCADGEVDLFVMRADGTGLRRLTDAPGNEADPAWSPDGQRIAYTDAADAPIDVMRADGSRKRNVPNTRGGGDPSWSPDGRRIAFGDRVPTEDPYDGDNNEVFTVETDGTGLTNVTDSPSQDREPDWSPDGRRIAFSSDRAGELAYNCDPDRSSCDTYAVYVANRDGSGPARLSEFVRTERVHGSPAWSPTGTRLAFDTGESCCGSEIFVANADGTGLTNVTADSGLSGNFGPAWRPRPQR